MRSLWKLGGMTWWDLAKRIWFDDWDVFGRAAQLSYYFLLALIPLLLFLTSVIGFFLGPESSLRLHLFGYLAEVMPPSAYEVITAAMKDISLGSSGGKLSFGLLAALWAASSGMGAITSSLNAAYAVKETRPWWFTRMVAMLLTLGLAVLIITALVLVLCGENIADKLVSSQILGEWVARLWKFLQWPIVIAFVLLAFSLIYYFSPNLKRVRWHWFTPGSAIGTVLWLAVSLGLRVYLQFFDTYSKTYGSLGAVIILMLWLYVSGTAVLIGGKINAAIESAETELANRKTGLRMGIGGGIAPAGGPGTAQ